MISIRIKEDSFEGSGTCSFERAVKLCLTGDAFFYRGERALVEKVELINRGGDKSWAATILVDVPYDRYYEFGQLEGVNER